MKGLFVVVEGIDGSGKTTLLQGLAEILFQCSNRKIVLTKEPTGGAFGRRLRLFSARQKNPFSKAKEFLSIFSKDRRQHISKIINPALDNGWIVLCDRYKHSSYAFQQAQGLSFKEVHSTQKRFPPADIVFVLDLPAEAALKRILADSSRKRKTQKFEQLAFLKIVRAKFLELKKRLPMEKIFILDASKPKEKVLKQAWRHLRAFL